jgi:hypothetical protein
LFAVVFAKAGHSRGWVVAVTAGTIACILCDAALSGLHAAPGIGLVIAAASFAAALALGMRGLTTDHAGGSGRPTWDLPARAVATMVLVVAITGASSALGPHLTGILTPFPVATSVLAAFVLAHEGSPQATVLLRGFLRGEFGFATFCFLVAVLLRPLGTALGFTVAAAGAIMVQITFVVGLARLRSGYEPLPLPRSGRPRAPRSRLLGHRWQPNPRFAIRRRSGASRARTDDLVTASHALSQLSYSPDEIEVTCKVNTCPLIGAWPDESQPYLGPLRQGVRSRAS